ncbi:DDT and Zinc finger domain containing protein [Aphelenchoides bicaudatus]|nr:DDT and Zinc finger domain containing protein [Aphelenchoides bicaudatus]
MSSGVTEATECADSLLNDFRDFTKKRHAKDAEHNKRQEQIGKHMSTLKRLISNAQNDAAALQSGINAMKSSAPSNEMFKQLCDENAKTGVDAVSLDQTLDGIVLTNRDLRKQDYARSARIKAVAKANGTNVSDDSDNEAMETDSQNVEKGAELIPLKVRASERALLVLPESNHDAVLTGHSVILAAEVYEICLNFYRLLKLAPFLFEDFCVALATLKQTKLLAEIHMAFVRFFFREERKERVLRQYLQSDSRFDCAEVLSILNENYPFVNPEKRLIVLKYLYKQFLQSDSFREWIEQESIQHDKECRVCGHETKVTVKCEGCEAVYHSKCIQLEDPLKAENCFCEVCHAIFESDVIDQRFMKQTMRKVVNSIPPLGHDRDQRVYWLVGGRLCVQEANAETVFYYSTLPRLYALFKQLDTEELECELCEALLGEMDNIVCSMTKSLKRRRRQIGVLGQDEDLSTASVPYFTHLDADNIFYMARILNDLSLEAADGDARVEPNKLVKELLQQLGVKQRRLEDTFWSGGLNEQQLKDLYAAAQSNENENAEISLRKQVNLLYEKARTSMAKKTPTEKLAYANPFVEKEDAKTFKQRNNKRQNLKNLSERFSITDEYSFSWSLYNDRSFEKKQAAIFRILRHNMAKFFRQVPEELMRYNWTTQKRTFFAMFNRSTTVEDLRYMLLQFELMIRRSAFNPCWSNSSAIPHLIRMITEDKQNRRTMEKRKDTKLLNWVSASLKRKIFLEPKSKVSTKLDDLRLYEKAVKRSEQQSDAENASILPIPKPNLFRTRSSQKPNIFIPHENVLKRLARQGGLEPAERLLGLTTKSKANYLWPYLCNLPIFETVWRFSVAEAQSIHALALQFLVLYSCIRWGDIDEAASEKPNKERTIIGYRELPPNGQCEQYLVRQKKLVEFGDDSQSMSDSQFMDVDSQDSAITDETVPESRSRTTSKYKLRSRNPSKRFLLTPKAYGSAPSSSKHTPHQRYREVEEWMDADQLELYEIFLYWCDQKRAVKAEPRK